MARILLVDDEGALRGLLRTVMELEDHEVVEAEDGRYALEQLQRGGHFDVMILDLMMPWVDGWEVLKNMNLESTKVIVVTARDDQYSEDRAERAHDVFRYFTKPYDPDELLDAVSAALA